MRTTWAQIFLLGELVYYIQSNPSLSMNFMSSHVRQSSKNGIQEFFLTLFGSLKEEFRYRKSSLEQYRDQLTGRLLENVEKFRRDQEYLRNDAKVQLETYAMKVNQLYNETLLSLQRQQQSVMEMQQSEAKQFVRPKRIDESLEEFRKSFNETEFLNGILSNRWKPAWVKSPRSMDSFSKLDPFPAQIEALTTNLQKNWNFLLQLTSEGTRNADNLVQKTLDDFSRLQEELKVSSKMIEKATQELFPITLRLSDDSISFTRLQLSDLPLLIYLLTYRITHLLTHPKYSLSHCHASHYLTI